MGPPGFEPGSAGPKPASLSKLAYTPLRHADLAPILKRQVRRGGHAKKVKISITVSPNVLNWVQERIGGGLPFGSLSHAFESGIVALMANERPQ